MADTKRLPKRLHIAADSIEFVNIKEINGILDDVSRLPGGGVAAWDFSLHIQISNMDTLNDEALREVRALRGR